MRILGQCARGHVMDAENTYVSPSGRPGCRTCIRGASKAYYERQRAKSIPAGVAPKPPSRAATPIIDRIAEHVAWDGTCLIWTRSTCRGYGQMLVGSRADGSRRMARVNRLILERELGRPLGADECALHTCDNPPCVHPDHLYAGDRLQNAADMVARGRQRTVPLQGERNGQARLTAAQVAEIRASSLSRRELRERYGVSKSTIARVVRRESWL